MNLVLDRDLGSEGSGQAYDRLAARCLQGLGSGSALEDSRGIINRKGERVHGSCVWVLEDENYQAWWNSSDPKILWLSGGPGKGKTVIATFLTEALYKIAMDDEDKTFIYFFCDSRNENKNSELAILRSLISQLLQQRPDLFQHILPEFQVLHESVLGERQSLWWFFQTMILSLECQTYCIIDGLDECDPGSLSFLVMKLKATALFKTNPTGGIFKLIIVSRETYDLRELSFHEFPNNSSCFQRLDLNSPSLRGKVESSIERFIIQETEQLAHENNYTVELKEDVKRVLIEGANGTYLWVAIMCQELRGKDPTRVLETLAGLPQRLCSAYKRMLLEIRPSDHAGSAAILRQVTLAAQPLTLMELATATNLPYPAVLSSFDAIRSRVRACGNLLEVEEDTRVKFTYPSAKKYFFEQAPNLFRVQQPQ